MLKKRICFILPKGLPVPAVKGGAVETLINNLIDKNEQKHNFEFLVATIYDEKAYSLSKTYKHTKFMYVNTQSLNYRLLALIIHFLNFFGKNLNTYNEFILKKLKKEKLDYIIVEDGAYHQFSSYLKYFKKEQMILHMHHNGYSSLECDKTFSTFFGVSDFVVNEFKKTSDIKNLYTFKNAIDIEKFTKKITKDERKSLQKKYDIGNDDFTLLFVGRLIKEKGVLELINAIEKINDEHIKLIIVGSINFGNIENSPYLETIAKKIKNNKNIQLTGFIHNDDLYKYYQLVDLMVVPSMWNEAAGLVLIEAAISGLPIITTKSGGIAEYVDEHNIIVSRDDIVNNLCKAITDMRDNVKKREEAINCNKAFARNFDVDTYYDNFITLIEKVSE